MGGKSGKGGDSDYAPNLDPLIQQQAGQSQQIFGATSPLLGGISAQYMNMLGIPYQTGGGATMGGTPAQGGNPQLTWGGANGYSWGNPGQGGTPGYGGTTGSLLPENPGTGIADLSDPSRVRPGAVNTFANKLDAQALIPELVAPDATASLFNAGRAGDLASQFTALPDNVSQFGAAKELAEAQFARAKDEALSSLGGAGGSGAIYSTMGNLASDRAMGLSQVFANLAANEAAARERGFDRGIGIESGNVGREQQVGLFNTANDFSAANTLAQMQYGSDQANIDRSLTAMQNRANTQNQINQNNIDRAIGIATGGTQMGMQGMQGAGNLAYNQGALAQQQYNSDNAKKGGIGQGIGGIIAAGKMG